jgi:hypothetical protein
MYHQYELGKLKLGKLNFKFWELAKLGKSELEKSNFKF